MYLPLVDLDDDDDDDDDDDEEDKLFKNIVNKEYSNLVKWFLYYNH